MRRAPRLATPFAQKRASRFEPTGRSHGTTVVKHAHASHAHITVDIGNGRLTAEITDDGIGGASTMAGTGLRGLADRLDTLGGNLSILSPDAGLTTIRACAPLPPHHATPAA